MKENPIRQAAETKAETETKAPDQVNQQSNFLQPPKPEVPDVHIDDKEEYFKLPGGANSYVCKDGTRINCMHGVITSWEPQHQAELEENVRRGGWQKFPASELKSHIEITENKSVIA